MLILICAKIVLFGYATVSDTVVLKSPGLALSYNTSLIYPGFRCGAEIPQRIIHLIKTKKHEKEVNIDKERYLTVNLSFYHHPSFHNNLYLTAGWTMRRLNQSGFFTEFAPEIGISRTFLNGTTYRVNDNGNVSIEKGAGYFYALLSLGGGIGYDAGKTKKMPFSIFSRFNVLTLFPYNSTFYFRPSINIGIIYKAKLFSVSKVKVQFRRK
jgi:hypothetical protein